MGEHARKTQPKENSGKIWRLLGAYTLVFCVMFCAVFGIFFVTGHSFIRTSDGLNQYYTSLAYYGELLRTILRNAFVSHSVTIPMYDLSIGYGGDILATLHYYGVGEPLALLSVLCSQENIEACFCFLFVLRLYLAGLFFCVLCRRHGHRTLGIVCGSMIYIFSGYTLYLVTNYIMFAVPMICLPLMFMGIDDVLQKKRPYLYIASVFLSAISNFYFFYMVSIFMVLYAVVRFFYLYSAKGACFEESRRSDVQEHRGRIKRMFCEGLNHLWHFVIYYLAGALLSMPVLLPVIMGYLLTGRRGISYPVPLLYEPIAYFVNFLELFYNFNGDYLGYSLLFLAVLIVIFRKKTHWVYKAVVCLMALFLCVPLLGSAMNGFSYVSNRYQFGLAFAAAYLISRFFENIYELSRREKLFAAAAAICLMLLAGVVVDDKRVFLCMVLCSAGILLFLCVSDRFLRVIRIAVPFLALVSIVLVSNLRYRTADTNDSIVNYMGRGRATEAYQNSLTGEFIRYASDHDEVYADVAGGGSARYAQKEPYEFSAMNSSLLTGIHGMQFYFSIYSDCVADFNRSLAINAMNDFCYSGVEGRSILLHLLNAGYLVTKNGEEVYGFEPFSDGEGMILHSRIAGGIGYTYQRALSYEEWEKMDAVERQYAILQAAAISERSAAPSIPFVPAQELSQTYRELEYVCQGGEGINISDKEWNITNTSEVMKISIGAWPEEVQDSFESGVELYVVLEGVDYAGDATNVMLDISAGNMSSQMVFLTPKRQIYTGRHDFICNLGLIKEEVGEIQITFDKEGIYSFDSMKIICQPMNGVDAYYDALFKEVLEEVEIDTNVIRGRIQVPGDRLFVLAVPYSDGFRAYVDGQQTSVMKVNEMMMGINLTAGEHEIVFCYTTPGLRAGWVLCLCGLLLCSGIILCQKRKRKKNPCSTL